MGLIYYTWVQLREHDRIARLCAKLDRYDAAGLAMIGWHTPKGLNENEQTWRAAMGIAQDGAQPPRLQRADDMHAVIARGVLSDVGEGYIERRVM